MHRVTVVPRRPVEVDVERERLAEVWRTARRLGIIEVHAVEVWGEAHNLTLDAALAEVRRG